MKKVLLADDDFNLLFSLDKILKNYGYTVYSTLYGEQVIKKLITIKPDILVMDIHLGLTDAREICKKIRENKNFKEMPIILYSADSFIEQDDIICANKFILKPFTPDELIGNIEELVH